ncbi:flavin-containing monooxygenase [Metapseudomonas resinovorans]|uniref:flavin-containing monooxygenase n=1 Tax=Metapseudomonas resinovorans TaxID=53412 RepID=UPI00042839C0|nr:NAD(P)/FAD-dependent oxidoreductase [Pseudomonas resinovorans]MDE3738766.1 NAD(P)/FAD-dependent oxidoreductase [Pseudomonas resinovorans]
MTAQSTPSQDILDVLIVGAGLSGIGAACYLKRYQPSKRFQVLEARNDLGGTWDLFRYPGIRSDSDLYTFGFEFKPWKDEKAIADASAIMSYLRETVTEHQIDRHIRYGQRVIAADWRSECGWWEVQVEDAATGQRSIQRCRWLFSAGGYYRYDQGFSPAFDGIERFQGQVIHPQRWPESLDYAGKRVLVIGSGATAVTLVPAMADKAAHVTMLQRTPSYVIPLPAKDPIALLLRKLLPEQTAYSIVRYKNARVALALWRFCQRFPNAARRIIRFVNARALPKDYPVDVHFNPPYNPWDQRLCVVPDSDLFRALGSGKASIVTDQIDRFTEQGVRLKSGVVLEADIVITATGLNVQVFGGVQLSRDGQPIAWNETVAYKGMMLSGIPNFAFAVGYTNASWTLKVSLLCEHFCRLLGYMDDHGHTVCEPKAPAGMPTRPLLDFGAGYVQRVLANLPRQGPGMPWVMSMDYFKDVKLLRKGPVADACLTFSAAPAEQAVAGVASSGESAASK